MNLKPCPFCGNTVQLEQAYSLLGMSVIYCNDCDMFFTLDDISASDDDICKAWNRRTYYSERRWIPCSERLPDPLQNVIICTDIKTVTIAWINGEFWHFADTGNGHIEQWDMSDVTHWMPLPEPYRGE